MRGRRTAAAAAVFAGLLAGLVTGPLSDLLGQAEQETRSIATPLRTAVRTPVVPAGSVLVIAHRGFSDIAPENTVPAMQAAADADADLVEFDVQRTADGHLVVVHDATLARTTNIGAVFPHRVNDPVGSFTLSEVRQLDAGSWKGPQFVGTRVPTLDEVLTVLHPTSSGVLLELKDPALYPGYETQVVRALARQGFIGSGRVHVHSVDVAALAAFHRLAPSVPHGVITEDRTATGTSRHDTWIDTIEPAAGTMTDRGADSPHIRHLKVLAWPLDPDQSSTAQVERFLCDGVAGIITDNPILVRHAITSADASTT